MARRLEGITLDNMSALAQPCRSCVFWELDPAAGDTTHAEGAGALEKEAWVSDTLLEWGTCGQVLFVDEQPAGYVLFAPAAYVPRAAAFATSPVSPDAVLLMTARLDPQCRGTGLGRILVQAVARDIARRGIRAIEAFGNTATDRGPSGRASDEVGCLLPADYLRAVGFKTVRAHPRTPRLRLDIRSTASWLADVEGAIDRLLSSWQKPLLSGSSAYSSRER
ncbi:GNAT family N-acetyltransferase [uncultured Jatrophihabitans sp.]|uniref:GNAT family N-acetyltransferase n=1 Tax=uncultured Jatrophihabitans sp. TaxID=1610747 RepID=UPI0035CBDD5D